MAARRRTHPGLAADALATITPALLIPARSGPPAAVLRAALYQQAFRPARPGTGPGPQVTEALAWGQHHSLPVSALADPRIVRRALDCLTVRLDGTRAAATTIARKRAVFGNCRGYAVELGLLEANPLDRVSWHLPTHSRLADPRSLPGPAQVRAILAETTRIRPELAAFFGCLYYAALRPAEAIALRTGDCDLPPGGWGQLTLMRSLPRSARAWTTTRSSHEPRGLKLRPQGTVRVVPIPPELVRMLRHHLQSHGCATDGRLFRGTRGGPLSESLYSRTWHQAITAAIPAAQPLRPYDLRHAALSLWLASGAPPPKSPPAPGTASTSCWPPTPTPCPATPTSPPGTPAGPRMPAPAPRWPTEPGTTRSDPVRHASVPQLDPMGHNGT
ncbi:MAG TPA: tyrosine-type recombinase/integrase [Streptosporangiaceae bacterium]|nr:tyrosine-type recombinase/integrase [Streptosporangiaceae bacterium]